MILLYMYMYVEFSPMHVDLLFTLPSHSQILDSFTLFTVLVLSYVFLRTRYLIIHLMGVALALIGIFSLVLVDFNSPINEAGKVIQL